MKIAISTWSFPGDWSLEKQLSTTASAGFAGFEIDLTEGGPVNLNSSASELANVRKTFAQHKLELTSLATGLYWGANAASADASVRAKADAILKKQLEAAAELQAGAVLVVPGAVGVDFIPGAEVVPYDKAWERATAFVERALPTAEKLGVVIGIENVWNKFLLSPLEMKSFVDQFNSKFVKSYFDVGNTLATSYPEHWISILGDRIERVHFKDYRRAVGSVDGFVDLLSGDVNWPAVVQALKDTGYKGWVTAEMIPPVPFYKHHPEVLIENTSRAIKKILGL
jgi:L-ribulose-5-phosphate 3-epimerase